MSASARGSPHRAWVFTWNNYPADAYVRLSAERARFPVINVGKEVGASGTPHLQGHIVSKAPVRLSTLTRLFPGVHFEPRLGSEQQAREYTEKEGNPDRLDWDDRQQGSRTDIQAMTALVAANPLAASRAVAAAMPHLYVKYHAGVAALARQLLPPTSLLVRRIVCWHWGPTGTGKTHSAVTRALAEAHDENDVFVWSLPNLKFAGTYAGQSHVVIDELRTNWEHFSFSGLLSLLGNSRHEVEVKGGTVPWRATRIWVTAPVAPQNFACLVGDPIEQLLRRIAVISEFNVPYVAPPPAEPDAAAAACPDPRGSPAPTEPLFPDVVSHSDVDLLPPVRAPPLVVSPHPWPPVRLSYPVSDSDSSTDCELVVSD